MRRTATVIALLCVLLLPTACTKAAKKAASAPPPPPMTANGQLDMRPASGDDQATALAKQFKLTITGQAQVSGATFPATLDGSEWATVAKAATAGGFDVGLARGGAVKIRRFEVSDTINGQPLYLWFLQRGNLICGAYLTPRTEQAAAKVAYAVTDPQIKH